MASGFDTYYTAVDNLIKVIKHGLDVFKKNKFIRVLKDSSGSEYTLIGGPTREIEEVYNSKEVYDYNYNGSGVNVTMSGNTVTQALFSPSIQIGNILSNNTQAPADDCLIYTASSSDIDTLISTIENAFR